MINNGFNMEMNNGNNNEENYDYDENNGMTNTQRRILDSLF